MTSTSSEMALQDSGTRLAEYHLPRLASKRCAIEEKIQKQKEVEHLKRMNLRLLEEQKRHESVRYRAYETHKHSKYANTSEGRNKEEKEYKQRLKAQKDLDVKAQEAKSRKKVNLAQQHQQLDALRKSHDEVEHEMRLEILRQAEGKVFTQVMHAKLPFELREMVYGHMFADAEAEAHKHYKSFRPTKRGVQFSIPDKEKNPVYSEDKVYAKSTAPTRKRKEIPDKETREPRCQFTRCGPGCFTDPTSRRQHFTRMALPVCLLPSHVGPVVANEAAYVFYQSKNTNLHTYPLDALSSALSTDHLHLGIIPADHLSRLKISLTSLKFSTGPQLWSKSAKKGCAFYRGKFQALRQLKKKNGLQLCFDIGERSLLAARRLLQILRPIYVELKTEGVKIRIFGRVHRGIPILDPVKTADGELSCLYDNYDEWAVKETVEEID